MVVYSTRQGVKSWKSEDVKVYHSLVLGLVSVPPADHIPIGCRVLQIAALKRIDLALQVGQTFLDSREGG